MSNSDTMSMGGVSSSIGPLQMRRVAPWQVSAQDIIVPERNLFQDNLFSSVRERLANVSFSVDSTRLSPEFNSRVQVVREQLDRATTHKRPDTIMPKR